MPLITIVRLYDSGTAHKLDQILMLLQQINQRTKEIKMTDSEVLTLLGQVDTTTTKIGSNLEAVATAQQAQADVVQEISDDIDRLIANPGASGISAEAAQKLQTLADKLQVSSDKSDAIAVATQAQVPVLQGIAARSQPVVPEPPAPPVIQ